MCTVHTTLLEEKHKKPFDCNKKGISVHYLLQMLVD